MPSSLPPAWDDLWRSLNNAPPRFGQPGVRDPDNICEGFDGKGYDGHGRCSSDGHYLCVECSELSPDAPRFTQDRNSRGDRLRLFWSRHR